MVAKRCLFVPSVDWGDDPHVSFGVHLQDEDCDKILCGDYEDCGVCYDKEKCVILWEESQWGKGAPHIGDTVEYVDFNINMTLFGVVDSVYKNLTKKPEENS